MLIRLIEEWKKSLSNKIIFQSILMDLSKAFDCIPHDLPIPEHVYGISKDAIAFMYSYLN